MNLYHFSNKRKLDKVISHLRFSYKEKEKPKEYVNWRKPSHQLFTNVGEVLKSIIHKCGGSTEINYHKQNDRKKVESDI